MKHVKLTDAQKACLQLFAGMMDPETKLVPPISMNRIEELLMATPHSYRFVGRYNQPVHIYGEVVEPLLNMGLLGRQRDGHAAYGYRVLCDVEDHEMCVRYLESVLANIKLIAAKGYREYEGSFYIEAPRPEPRKVVRCKECGASIIWARTEYGGKIPLDADLHAFWIDVNIHETFFVAETWLGDVALKVKRVLAGQCHFTTCIARPANQEPDGITT